MIWVGVHDIQEIKVYKIHQTWSFTFYHINIKSVKLEDDFSTHTCAHTLVVDNNGHLDISGVPTLDHIKAWVGQVHLEVRLIHAAYVLVATTTAVNMNKNKNNQL